MVRAFIFVTLDASRARVRESLAMARRASSAAERLDYDESEPNLDKEHGLRLLLSGTADPRKDPEVQRIYLEMLRADCAFFAQEVLKIEIGPHMLIWSDLISSTTRLCVNAARDHSKSTLFSYVYPIWRAWSEPGCEIYVFSSTLEQAQEFLDIIVYGKNNLKGMTQIDELAHLLPDERNRDQNVRRNRSDVRMTNGSRIRVAGFGKAMRGRHPKYIVLDDVLNDEDMWSEVTRRKHIEYFRSAITNMVAPDGQLIVVGTPFHASDLYGVLRKNPVYTFCRFPGIIKDKATGKERALFPWRWSLKQLYNKRLEIGSVAFAREILVQPISDDISIFPSYLFPPCFDPKRVMGLNAAQLKAQGMTAYFGVDIARSASVGADYFVIFVLARDDQGNHLVNDIRRTKGLSFRRQLAEIAIAAAIYDPALIFIESNAMQQIYSSEMRRETDLPVKEFVTLATNKYPLDKGVPGLRIQLEGHKLILPRGNARSCELTDLLIDEATQFGFVDGKLQGIGEHDDIVMAWWIATEASRAGGFSFTFDEGEDNDSEMTGAPSAGGDDEDWERILLGDNDEAEDDLRAS